MTKKEKENLIVEDKRTIVHIIEGYGAGVKGIKEAIKKLGVDIYIEDYVEEKNEKPKRKKKLF